jgi:hypothetical protein
MNNKRLGIMTGVALVLYAFASFMTITEPWFSLIIKGMLAASFPLALYLIGFFTGNKKGQMNIIFQNLKDRLKSKNEVLR